MIYKRNNHSLLWWFGRFFLKGFIVGSCKLIGYKKEKNRQGRLQWGIQRASKGTMKLMVVSRELNEEVAKIGFS